MKPTVIIVTYNNQKTIKQCINSVPDKYPILIVDNSSSDKSLEKAKKTRKKLQIINNKKNLGFSAAVNQALKKINGDAILLNPDAVIEHSTIKTLGEVGKEEHCTAVTCKIVNPKGKMLPSCGNFPTPFNIALARIPYIRKYSTKAHALNSPAFYKKKRYPDWVAGTCMYLTREGIEKVGYFDEDYFMYTEDVDWCFRAREKGLKVIYTPKTKITHLDEGKSPEKYPNKFYHMRRGFLLFFQKHGTEGDIKQFKALLKLELLLKKPQWKKNWEKWAPAYNKCQELL